VVAIAQHEHRVLAANNRIINPLKARYSGFDVYTVISRLCRVYLLLRLLGCVGHGRLTNELRECPDGSSAYLYVWYDDVRWPFWYRLRFLFFGCKVRIRLFGLTDGR
jgi:hypothetical protein